MTLGEELQNRLQRSLEAELSFYTHRGILNKDEQEVLSATFTKALYVTTKTLPQELANRSLRTPVVEDKSLTDRIEQTVEDVMVKLGLKATYDDSPWDGDASNWKTAESYSSCCLIDLNKGGGPKTKDNCKLPYKKEGNASINKNALKIMASGACGLPALRGVPRSEIVKAANFMIRHWKGAFGKSAPPNIYRLAGKKAPGDVKESQVQFFKDKSGQWWMLGMYSNRWMDREREIISEAAHKEYASWLNKSGFKPPIVVYHLPKLPQGFWEIVWDKYGNDINKLNDVVSKVYAKTSIGFVERVVNLNGFAIAVAKIREDKLEVAEKLASMGELGMSHGFLVFQASDPKDFSLYEDTINIIEKYRSFEMSLLLRERAANFGTGTFFVEEKAVPYSEDDLKVIREVLPEDLIEALDDGTKTAEGVLDRLLEMKEFFGDNQTPEAEEKAEGESSEAEDEEEEEMEKEKQEDVQEEVKTEEVSQEEEVEQSEETKDVDNEAQMVAKVIEKLNVDQLQEILTTIVDQQKTLVAEIEALKNSHGQISQDVKALKQTEDEKIAAAITPGINWANVGYSPSQAKDNVASEEKSEELQQAAAAGQLTGDQVIDHFFSTINSNRQ